MTYKDEGDPPQTQTDHTWKDFNHQEQGIPYSQIDEIPLP